MKQIKKLSDLNLRKVKFVQKKPMVLRAIELEEFTNVNNKEGKPGDFIIENIVGEIKIVDRRTFFKTYDYVRVDKNE